MTIRGFDGNRWRAHNPRSKPKRSKPFRGGCDPDVAFGHRCYFQKSSTCVDVNTRRRGGVGLGCTPIRCPGSSWKPCQAKSISAFPDTIRLGAQSSPDEELADASAIERRPLFSESRKWLILGHDLIRQITSNYCGAYTQRVTTQAGDGRRELMHFLVRSSVLLQRRRLIELAVGQRDVVAVLLSTGLREVVQSAANEQNRLPCRRIVDGRCCRRAGRHYRLRRRVNRDACCEAKADR